MAAVPGRVRPTIAAPAARRLVELACRAPSVHNTQPWAWAVDGNSFRLYADRGRQLAAEDPAGRNLMISCGAALDHFVLAAAALGWDAHVDRLPDGPRGDLVARIELDRGAASSASGEDLELIALRHTDRRHYTSWPVPGPLLAALAAEARKRGAHARCIDSSLARHHFERLAGWASSLRDDDDAAGAEQARWVDRSDEDGVPRTVLPADTDPTSAPPSRFGEGLVRETRQVAAHGDGVVVLGGAYDDPTGWLHTGEALSALWLRATRSGLSVVPLSLPIEVDAVRHELRHGLLDGEFAPHLVVRVGWQAIGRHPLPPTPRRAVTDVLR